MSSDKYQIVQDNHNLNSRMRDHDFVHFVSKSKKPDKRDIIKHWVGKIYKKDQDSEWHEDFLESAILDSFLSRVLHSMDKRIPKTKIISATEICSRLYPLTKESENVWNKNLFEVLRENKNKSIALDGMLKSIIYRIIIQDWDSKPENFACYPKPGIENCYIVAPFDLTFSLGSDEVHKKEWKPWEILSIARGTKTISGRISVAEALCETIGGLGGRTNGPYYAQRRDYLEFGRYAKGVLINSIDSDLQEIINKSDGRINTKSAAFLEAFSCALKEMSGERGDRSDRTKPSRRGFTMKIECAAHEVLENISSLNDDELPEGVETKTKLQESLGEYHSDLRKVIKKFEKNIADIKLALQPPAYGLLNTLAGPALGEQVTSTFSPPRN